MTVHSGEARRAAKILVDVWKQCGCNYDHYDIVWRAKEYLHDRADELAAQENQQ